MLRSSLLAFSLLVIACSSETPNPPPEDAGGATNGGGAPSEGGGGVEPSSGDDSAGEGGAGDAKGEAGGAPDEPGVVPPAESEGCGTMSAYEPGTTASSLVVGGGSRAFRIHVPPSYEASTPLPVVLMFHGGGGSGRQIQEASAEMDPIADREGFITVYPDGTGALRTWNGGGCCGAAVTQNTDDIGFVRALLDHVEASLCVDRHRVFASGMSNGAILSHRLGCELSERLAAIAPVAGTDLTSSCSPTRPIAVMHTHGTDDGHVPWAGGQGCGPTSEVDFTSVPDTLEHWRVRNGCGATTTVTFTQGNGSCETYDGCAAGADVTLCSIDGGGHSWPGGKPAADLVECPGNGPQSASFSASDAIWRFFSAHPRRGL